MDIQKIKTTVLNYYNSQPGFPCIHPDELNLNTRKREIVLVRQVSMYFAKRYSKLSLAKIGQEIGGKDHATVLHACKTVSNLYDTDKLFRLGIDELENIFKSKMISNVEPEMQVQIRLKTVLYYDGLYHFTLYGIKETSKTRTIFRPVKSVQQVMSMVNVNEVDSINIHMDYRKVNQEILNEDLKGVGVA
jgi:hypothetical protein